MHYWTDRRGLTPCDFAGWRYQSFIEDEGSLWRVKGPQHITPPLELEIYKETGTVRELGQHEPITKEILDR